MRGQKLGTGKMSLGCEQIQVWQKESSFWKQCHQQRREKSVKKPHLTILRNCECKECGKNSFYSVVSQDTLSHILMTEVPVPNDFGFSRAERHKIWRPQEWSEEHMDTERNRNNTCGGDGNRSYQENLKQYLQTIPSCPNLHKIQIAASKGTVIILKRALGYKTSGV